MPRHKNHYRQIIIFDVQLQNGCIKPFHGQVNRHIAPYDGFFTARFLAATPLWPSGDAIFRPLFRQRFPKHPPIIIPKPARFVPVVMNFTLPFYQKTGKLAR